MAAGLRERHSLPSFKDCWRVVNYSSCVNYQNNKNNIINNLFGREALNPHCVPSNETQSLATPLDWRSSILQQPRLIRQQTYKSRRMAILLFLRCTLAICQLKTAIVSKDTWKSSRAGRVASSPGAVHCQPPELICCNHLRVDENAVVSPLVSYLWCISASGSQCSLSHLKPKLV